MPITNISYFSKDSFTFEDAVGDVYGSRKIKLTARDQGPLLLKLETCLSYGVNKNSKFGKVNYSVPISLKDREAFVSVLELVERESAKHLDKPGEEIMKCLYRKANSPVLYAKIDDDTEMYPTKGDEPVDHKKYQDKRFNLNAIIKVDSIYVSDSVTSIQVKLREAQVLEDAPRKPRKMLL